MTLRLACLALAVLAQLAVAGSSVWRAESALRSRVYRIATRPVDPVDWFRGRYVAIGFPRSVLPRGDAGALEEDGTAFATLEVGEDGFARLVAAYARPPDGVDSLPVRVVRADERRVTVEIPFDRFYLEEERAPQLEAEFRERRGLAVALVRVGRGEAVLEDLRIEPAPAPRLAPLRARIRTPRGEPLPDELLAALKAANGSFERCGADIVCVAFPVELDGEKGAEYVVQDDHFSLMYYVPAPGASPTYAWKARLQPLPGKRVPLGERLLALLEDDPGAAQAAEPAYRDLRLGGATLAVPH